MKMWILNCRKVSHLVSESMDHKLGFSKRIGVRFHLMMCRHCARFAKQLTMLRQVLHDSISTSPPVNMDAETKQKIKNTLQEHQDRHH